MNAPAPGPEAVRFAAVKNMAQLATFALLAGCGITLFAPVWWVADLVANLRVQLLIALSTMLVCCLLVRKWRLAMVGLMAIAWQTSWLIPLTTKSPARMSLPVADGLLKVCSVNVLTSNRQHDRIIAGLRAFDADVVAILELGTELSDRLETDLGEVYPHRVLHPDDGGNFGIGLLSRLPLQNIQIFELSPLPLPSISSDVEWNDRTVHLVATHPIPPMSGRYFQSRNQHLRALAQLATEQRINRPTVPIVVVGDLNVTPWSPHFRSFQQTSGLIPSFTGPWFNRLQPTWYRWSAFPFGLVLDHAFNTPDLICRKRLVGADSGSDHRPVYVEYAVAEEK